MLIKEAIPYSLQEGCRLHRHPQEYELILFYLGRGTYVTGGRKIPFASPALFLTTPGTTHRIVVDPPCRLVRIFGIIFTWHDGTAALKKKARERLTTGFNPADIDCLSVFENIRRRQSTGDPLLARSAEALLLSLLYDLCAEGAMEPPVSANPYVSEAVQILKDSVYEETSADRVAEKVGIHKAYLIRLFKKHMGTTPMRYLADYRIDGTAWQLEHTDKPIHRIAREFMFYDEFHFSRTFKKKRGMSPARYRSISRG